MSKTSNDREFDVRLIERQLRLGKADPKTYQEYLKSVPDSSKNARYIEVYEDKDATIAENFEAMEGLTFSPVNLEP